MLGGVAAVGALPFVVLLDQDVPAGRRRAAGLGKVPTVSVRRLISLLTRSSGFVDQICLRCHQFLQRTRTPPRLAPE